MDKKNLKIIWEPSAKDLKSSAMAKFKVFAEKEALKPLPDFASLYSWSIEEPKKFWDLVVKHSKINFTSPPSKTLDSSDKFWNCSWFPGAKLNFSERILQPALSSALAEKIALICCNEDGERTQISFSELEKKVAILANNLATWGVKAGDRVAGLLNNTAHAVIGMLASAKIGAIWTSCSPDFGSVAIQDRFEQVSPKVLIAAITYFDPTGNRNELASKSAVISSEDKIINLVRTLPSLKKLVLLQTSDVVEKSVVEKSMVEKSVVKKEAIVRDGLKGQNHLSIILWDDIFSNAINDSAAQPKGAAANSAETGDTQRPNNKTPQQPYHQLPFDHPLVILYSSGTTGKPKCIVHRAGGVLLEHLKEHILHIGLTDKDTLFYYTSTSWMMWNWLISGLATGATIVLFDGSPAAKNWQVLWNLADSESVTIFGTSAKYLSVIEHRGLAPKKTHKLKNLRAILSTGSPLLESSYDYIHDKIKSALQIGSISGGTDLVGCFALSNPLTPVFRGELQGRSLGLAVNVYDNEGRVIVDQQGELVCEAPFPSMPLRFWNDSQDERYINSYFKRFPGVWHHGDFVTLTERGTLIFHGRSDATLNPGGVRIGTAEIYAQITEDAFPEIIDAVAVGKNTTRGEEIVLLLQLKPKDQLSDDLKDRIKAKIQAGTSKYHVPKHILAVPEIPRTHNHKIAEMAVADVVNGRTVRNIGGLANPESLEKISLITACIS